MTIGAIQGHPMGGNGKIDKKGYIEIQIYRLDT